MREYRQTQHSALSTQHAPTVRRAMARGCAGDCAVVARAFRDKFQPAFGTEEKAIRALTPYIAAEMTRRGNYVFVATIGGEIVGSVSVSTARSFVSGVAGMFYQAVGLWGTVAGALRAQFPLRSRASAGRGVRRSARRRAGVPAARHPGGR